MLCCIKVGDPSLSGWQMFEIHGQDTQHDERKDAGREDRIHDLRIMGPTR